MCVEEGWLCLSTFHLYADLHMVREAICLVLFCLVYFSHKLGLCTQRLSEITLYYLEGKVHE